MRFVMLFIAILSALAVSRHNHAKESIAHGSRNSGESQFATGAKSYPDAPWVEE